MDEYYYDRDYYNRYDKREKYDKKDRYDIKMYYRDVKSKVDPIIKYSMMEARVAGYQHALEEGIMIAYLMGMGLDFEMAHRVVESFEKDEIFPRY
ncbi:MAG: hypothetical protein ACLFMO_07530 [Eubacteriales bacterium]